MRRLNFCRLSRAVSSPVVKVATEVFGRENLAVSTSVAKVARSRFLVAPSLPVPGKFCSLQLTQENCATTTLVAKVVESPFWLQNLGMVILVAPTIAVGGRPVALSLCQLPCHLHFSRESRESFFFLGHAVSALVWKVARLRLDRERCTVSILVSKFARFTPRSRKQRLFHFGRACRAVSVLKVFQVAVTAKNWKSQILAVKYLTCLNLFAKVWTCPKIVCESLNISLGFRPWCEGTFFIQSSIRRNLF